jgi:hypothetical protein
MQKMVYGIATCLWEGWKECCESWNATASEKYSGSIVFNKRVLDAYQIIFKETKEPIIAYIHDDVMIYEQDWDLRVLKQFEDPQVGLVGFGGALRLGHPNIYKIPYELPQLARYDFMSNMRNAEAHGQRFSGECDVATLDGFAMFVRRSVLENFGGWPLGLPMNYFMYDNFLACQVRRQGLKTRLVGVDCEHLGGKTASRMQLPDSHSAAHEWFYEEFRDVLPFAVEEI